MSICIALIISTGALNSIFKIDSSALYDNKYYVNISQNTYSDLDISYGDLIFSVPTTIIEDGSVFSYLDDTGEYLFAKTISYEENSDVIVQAQANFDTVYVDENNINGVVKYIVPVIGALILFAQTESINISIVLTFMVFGILLVLCFGASKPKKCDDIDYLYNNLYDQQQLDSVQQHIEFEDINSFSK